ncbi:MAG: NADPH:quinone oxidoreductase family protein [Alphaproteobacteria bacterium]|nr:NADPH:quinone oxidoreductase family protein [Alphaproteobacteria bacterium]
MRAVLVEKFGSLDDIRLGETAKPPVKPGHVLVAVKAVGIGFVDVLGALGRYQVKQELPFVPGGELAGVVEAVGEGVGDIHPGDRVIGGGFAGAWAEYVLCPAAAVRRMPENMSFEQGAMFRTNYATALHGLRDRGQVAPGETLLVLGAAGGTGTAALQVGKILGARVIAAASTAEKRAAALQLGADEAVDYTDPAWREALKALTNGKGIDVVFDPVGGATTEQAFRSLAWKGRHLVVGYASGTIPALPINLALLKGASLVGVDVARFGNMHEPAKAQANLQELFDWFAAGKLSFAPGKVIPFDEIRQAITDVDGRRSIGKIVARIGA